MVFEVPHRDRTGEIQCCEVLGGRCNDGISKRAVAIAESNHQPRAEQIRPAVAVEIGYTQDAAADPPGWLKGPISVAGEQKGVAHERRSNDEISLLIAIDIHGGHQEKRLAQIHGGPGRKGSIAVSYQHQKPAPARIETVREGNDKIRLPIAVEVSGHNGATRWSGRDFGARKRYRLSGGGC
jgi:hypothetical protein